jgi:hypothetical protein
VAESLVIGVGDLIPKLLTDTFGGGRDLQLAGTVPALSFQPLSNLGHNLFVFIQTNAHIGASCDGFQT